MTKDERKVIFTGVGIVLVVLIIMVIVKAVGENKANKNEELSQNTTQVNIEKYATNLEDGTKINTGSEFNKNKKYKEIEISNIQFTYKEGKSVLLADLKNTGDTDQKSEIVKMTILDENGKEIEKLKPIIPNIKAGETKQLNVIISGADRVNAKDFKIEENKK